MNPKFTSNMLNRIYSSPMAPRLIMIPGYVKFNTNYKYRLSRLVFPPTVFDVGVLIVHEDKHVEVKYDVRYARFHDGHIPSILIEFINLVDFKKFIIFESRLLSCVIDHEFEIPWCHSTIHSEIHSGNGEIINEKMFRVQSGFIVVNKWRGCVNRYDSII